MHSLTHSTLLLYCVITTTKDCNSKPQKVGLWKNKQKPKPKPKKIRIWYFMYFNKVRDSKRNLTHSQVNLWTQQLLLLWAMWVWQAVAWEQMNDCVTIISSFDDKGGKTSTPSHLLCWDVFFVLFFLIFFHFLLYSQFNLIFMFYCPSTSQQILLEFIVITTVTLNLRFM